MYEPPLLERLLTNLAGSTFLRPYNKKYADNLNLNGNECVLDFCCGSGNLSKAIADRLPHGYLFAADVSQKWLTCSSEKLDLEKAAIRHLYDLSPRRLYKTLFDMAVIHFVLHDFSPGDRKQALHLVAMNTKPGGIIRIREPVNPRHGLPLFELVNLLESLGLTRYTYGLTRSRLLGTYMDVQVWL